MRRIDLVDSLYTDLSIAYFGLLVVGVHRQYAKDVNRRGPEQSPERDPDSS